MPETATDPISSWFIAAEDLGEFIGIRFGQAVPGKVEPEWTFMRHADYDGIGGLAHILRQRGADICRLPQIKHPASSVLLPVLRTWPTYAAPRKRVEWANIEGPTQPSTKAQPPLALAWHAFDEATTTQIRRVCRKRNLTVNSFLLKHLTKAIRPFLKDESSMVPWMVPVNMRGKVVRPTDTANYSSYIGVRVQSYETAQDIHRNIYKSLGRGEHWANWYAYHTGKFITHGLRKFLIQVEKCTSQWNIGGFSNLGDWDPDKQITQAGCAGPWFFAPPVLRMQAIGAGCVTFQNRLTLTIQVHPELTTNSKVPQAWMQNWIKEIEIDIASILTEPGGH
jgi:NRPS condensation-like uncharacterized protein